jgi:glucose-6-phosphate isomerase
MPVHRDPSGKERLGDLAADVDRTVADLASRSAVERIWDGDHTLWQDDPTEVADRLGWLPVLDEMAEQVATLEGFAVDCHGAGLTHAVVMGMGGSSLFPEVMARTFAPVADRLVLRVLDTTDPAGIARIEAECPLDTTLFVASSKSGSTIETRSHLAYFWEKVDGPEQFAVITDPGSALGELATERGFRTRFENRADIGGRYSALSYFGLVPAALAGVDIAALLRSAQAMADELRSTSGDDPNDHPGLRLGATMAAAARTGRDKLTLLIDPEIATFGLWLEQLLAESTGKHGIGVVPIEGEPVGPNEVYGADRLFVSIGWHPALDALANAGHPVVELPYEGAYSIGAHVVLWEFATAMCGAALGINPFDQPNVAEAKEATARVLAAGEIPVVAHEPLQAILEQARPGDYVALQAYVDPGSDVVADLQEARRALRDRLRLATTFGLGPRFLHSTGQLHKGGPPTAVSVQVVGDDADDPPIPGERFGFSTLKQAQAAGDLETLRSRGLRAARVALQDLLEAAT